MAVRIKENISCSIHARRVKGGKEPEIDLQQSIQPPNQERQGVPGMLQPINASYLI